MFFLIEQNRFAESAASPDEIVCCVLAHCRAARHVPPLPVRGNRKRRRSSIRPAMGGTGRNGRCCTSSSSSIIPHSGSCAPRPTDRCRILCSRSLMRTSSADGWRKVSCVCVASNVMQKNWWRSAARSAASAPPAAADAWRRPRRCWPMSCCPIDRCGNGYSRYPMRCGSCWPPIRKR